ncbi:hypothetical protein HIF96_08610 [Helcococcus kunzii]|uniref:hypothetical protein n=1 Tax=Helcococcus kunzii TaxID=40091 RepID=UPI001C971424|nr:hypothetical protein [Helcococcus kunzii]QZO76334.1 hypothetical protein HIF96_08610 [Helcococcus kunzii]
MQINFRFKDAYLDVLALISPTPLIFESKQYFEEIKFVNEINKYLRTIGRFYVDNNGDIAYSLRFKYDLYKEFDDLAANEIKIAVDFFSDLFYVILDVCFDIKSYEETYYLLVRCGGLNETICNT